MMSVTHQNSSKEVFRASKFWATNINVALLMLFGMSFLLLAVLVAFLKAGGSLSSGWPLFAFWVACIFTTFLAYFPGNLGVMWPNGVEVDINVVRFLGPMKVVSVPSLFWQGHVVKVGGHHGLLRVVIIPFYFGPERTRLIKSIAGAIERLDEA